MTRPVSRAGYVVVWHNEDDPDVQTYAVVTREATGAGIGSYATDELIDQAIKDDRAALRAAKAAT
jgi:hypothetical protein